MILQLACTCTVCLNPLLPSVSCSEQLGLLYNQLRMELLDAGNTILEHFELTRELRSAAEKRFFLKKLFWRVCT